MGKLSGSDSDVAGQAPMCKDPLVGLGAPERTSRSQWGSSILWHHNRSEELRYGSGYASNANCARDDPNLTFWWGVWNIFQYSSLV